MPTDLALSLTPDRCRARTFIVTGANAGLGLEITKHLVELESSRVVMAVRNLENGEKAKANIESETGRRGVLQVWHLDLAEYDTIKAFTEKANRELAELHGLISNAGLANGYWEECEGNESNITVNLIGPLLLAICLLPKLKRTAHASPGSSPSITFVGSVNAFHAQKSLENIDKSANILDDLNDRQKFETDIINRYGLSKLLLHFAVRELAALAPAWKTGVTINLVHPGLCKTGLARNQNVAIRFIASLMKMLVGRTAEMGSRTVLHGIAAGDESHGKYLTDCRISEESVPAWMTDEKGAAWQSDIWEQLGEVLNSVEPGCVDRALSDSRSESKVQEEQA